MNSLRDEVKDSIRSDLSGHFRIDETEVDAELVGLMADNVFGVIGISECEQDIDIEEWRKIPKFSG
jgi:hypothetical protein